MISHLSINGLGIIAAADLDLHPGLVVFTGETGAGKTMLVSALGLVLGDRFDTSLLAESGTKVQAALHLPATALSLTRLREAGGDVPEPAGSAGVGSARAGTATVDVIVGRHIPPSGRGRAIAGGATVPVSVLADLGADVASRHAQSDQIALRNARTQRRALDRFGGPTVAGALARYRDSYSTFLRLSRELAERTTADRDRAQRVATLREELTVIDAVDPASGEDESLTTAIARLANAEALRDDLATAGSLLSDDESGAVTMVAGAVAALQHARGTDPAAGELADRLLLLQDQLSDAASDVRGARR